MISQRESVFPEQHIPGQTRKLHKSFPRQAELETLLRLPLIMKMMDWYLDFSVGPCQFGTHMYRTSPAVFVPELTQNVYR